MIQLNALTKRYGSFTAVDALDLTVPKGELFGFLGPNGAGKTTTLRMIAGILRPTSGTAQINGIDVSANPMAAKAVLGYIPDRPFIYEKLTGAEFLRIAATSCLACSISTTGVMSSSRATATECVRS